MSGSGRSRGRYRPPPEAAACRAGRARARVLLALVRGQSNRRIAEDLGISAKTVGHHVQRVYNKAGVHSRAAATLWAVENDLVRTR